MFRNGTLDSQLGLEILGVNYGLIFGNYATTFAHLDATTVLSKVLFLLEMT